MSITAISSTKAPAAIGPYSQAVQAGGLLFSSGQLPIDPATGQMVVGPIGERARRCLLNLSAIAEAAGTALGNAVKVTVFLTDMADFAAVNEVYREIFAAPYPARSAVAVAALPLGSNIEIEAVFALA
jgi:2-iminobutanoate/2-iminopropanoate deaminase